MVNLAQLSQSNAYAQTSGPGFGTRMLCRPLNEHYKAPIDSSMWLSGLRRANALSTNTNPIPNSHMRSPGGFMEFFAGLRDPGDIQFEACWKNDVPFIPASVTDANARIAADFQRWQAPKESDGAGNKGFFHSLFYDRQPFEAWVIPPQWTRGLIVVRGYASMVGPFPHEMEGVINFQGSFKASGKPMILRGTSLGYLTAAAAITTTGTVAADLIPANLTGSPTGFVVPAAGLAKNKRYRAVSEDLLSEVWSEVEDGMTVPSWGEADMKLSKWRFYEYTEDEGFGEAF